VEGEVIKRILFVAGLLGLWAAGWRAEAQIPPDSLQTPRDSSQSDTSAAGKYELNPNIIYVTFATVIFCVSLDLSYERLFGDNVSIRAGVVAGGCMMEERERLGPFAVLNFLTSGKRNRFDLGMGGSYLRIKSTVSKREWQKFYPVLTLGYRYQPSKSFCMRIGASYCAVPGIHIGFGLAIADP